MRTEPEEPQHELVHLAPVQSDIRLLDFSPLYARKESLNVQSEIDEFGHVDEGEEDCADPLFRLAVPTIDPSSGRSAYRMVPAMLRPRLRPGDWKGVDTRIVDAPTILPRRRIWRDDVVTSLPFREVIRKMAIRANGVMMDDQRVIVVCVSRSESRRSTQIIGATLTGTRFMSSVRLILADGRAEERRLDKYKARDDRVVYGREQIAGGMRFDTYELSRSDLARTGRM